MSPIVRRYWELFEELRPTEADIPTGLYTAAAVLTAAEVLAAAIERPITIENTDYPIAVQTVKP